MDKDSIVTALYILGGSIFSADERRSEGVYRSGEEDRQAGVRDSGIENNGGGGSARVAG